MFFVIINHPEIRKLDENRLEIGFYLYTNHRTWAQNENRSYSCIKVDFFSYTERSMSSTNCKLL